MVYTVNSVVVVDMGMWNWPVGAKNRQKWFFYDIVHMLGLLGAVLVVQSDSRYTQFCKFVAYIKIFLSSVGINLLAAECHRPGYNDWNY